MAADPARRRDLAAGHGAELPLHLQRALWLLVDEFYDADDDGTALGEAVARFVFDHELLIVPATESMAREGMRFYPVTPHDVKPVWLVTPAAAPAPAASTRSRRPSLRDLGAQPIGGDRV